MSDDLRDQLQETILAHGRELDKPRSKQRDARILALAAKAKELRAALRKGKAA